MPRRFVPKADILRYGNLRRHSITSSAVASSDDLNAMLCERCLAMAFTFQKPSTACQITDFNLSGYRGALRRMFVSCPLYPRFCCKTQLLSAPGLSSEF